jgi:hypothetical protein
MDLTVANLVITADSTIDFAGVDARIFSGSLEFLSSDITLNIINWEHAVDFFYSSNWIGATYDTIGQLPMNQVVFNAPTFTGDQTIWDSYDDQIYPVIPEPSSYGALFLALCSAAFLWRRHLRNTRS